MKRRSLKYIERMAAHVVVEIEHFFHPHTAVRDIDTRHGFEQGIYEKSFDWFDCWYKGVDRDAMTFYGDDCLEYLQKKGYDVAVLDTNEDLKEMFAADVTRAYCDATRQAEETEFVKQCLSALEDRIAEVDAPYYCLLKCVSEWDPVAKKIKYLGFEETEHLYEASRVVFGFTQSWHKGKVAECNDDNQRRGTMWRATYDPDEAYEWAEEHVDDFTGRISTQHFNQGCADTADVVEMFADYNEIEGELNALEKHWATVAKITASMMNVQPTPDLT